MNEEFASQLVQALIPQDSGIQVLSASYTGSLDAATIFSDPLLQIGIEEGIILGSGLPGSIFGSNDNGAETTSFGTPGDADLDALISGTTFDAASLEFSFIPTSELLSFRYVFGSEEYNEYVSSQYNDVFGFYLTDKNGKKINIALIPGTSSPISINNVNNGSNSAYYRDNTSGSYFTELDGFTSVLDAVARVVPGDEYQIKLAIADTADQVLDSAVILQGNTFASTPLVAANDSFILVSGQPDAELHVVANDLFGDPQTVAITPLQSSTTQGGSITLITHGTASVADDHFLYNAPANFTGVDTFEYTLADGLGNSSTANVYIETKEPDTGSTVGIDLEILSDDNGTPGAPIEDTTIALGETFFIRVSAGDFRTNAAGISSLELDIQLDPAVLEILSYEITANLPENQRGTIDNLTGLIDNLGAGISSTGGTPIGSNTYELFALIKAKSISTTTTPSNIKVADTSILKVALGDSFMPTSIVADDSQVISVEEDLFGYQNYFFTYHFNNIPSGGGYFGDTYSGNGWTSLASGYEIGDIIPGLENDTGNTGFYEITDVDNYTDSDFWGSEDVYVLSYYDGGNDLDGNGIGGGGEAYSVWGVGYDGLRSESGYAYNSTFSNTDYSFDPTQSADLSNGSGANGYQNYFFTYYFNNPSSGGGYFGDTYSGDGYTSLATGYSIGDMIPGELNDTGNTGYYKITNVVNYEDSQFWGSEDVYAYNYYDGGDDTDGVGVGGGGQAYSAWISGNSGLGSEYGYAYNDAYSNSDYSVSPTQSADLSNGDDSYSGYQKYFFTYHFVNPFCSGGNKYYGDTYSGDGYTSLANGYEIGDIIVGQSNDFGYTGYYEITGIENYENSYFSGTEDVYVYEYYDDASDLDGVGVGGKGTAYYTWASGSNGLGSESGYAYNETASNPDAYIDPTSSADLDTEGEYQKYFFTYHFGNPTAGGGYFGDTYSGDGYTSMANAYSIGDIIPGQPNDTGNTGYYEITNVENIGSYSGGLGDVYVYQYTDGGSDTDGIGIGGGGQAYSTWATGSNGLGSESGYAYNETFSNPDAYIDPTSSADLLTGGYQKYFFKYSYGNGDSYSGDGYTDVLTGYQVGDIITGSPNDTGNTGQYEITATIEDYSQPFWGSEDVYVYQYNDVATDLDGIGVGGIAQAASTWATGNSGLGSESGYALNITQDNPDAFINPANSADMF